jgi:hypothetical protein
MRHNQNRRSRGRSRKGPNPLTRSYESNGPDVKVRGTAAHVADKYMSLARDAQSAGDTVSAENYLQHAEHYNRIVMAAQAQFQQSQPQFREGAEEGPDEDRQANGRGRFDYNGDGRGDGEDQLEASGDGEERSQRQGRRSDDQERPRGRQNKQEARQRSERNETEEPVDRGAEPQPDVPEPAAEAVEEAPPPPRRRRRKASAENTESQDDADSTKDGAAALAAFPE